MKLKKCEDFYEIKFQRGKKTRQTEEEVGRQHQGMDRPGVCKVPKGEENRKKWRKLVAKSSPNDPRG